MSPLLNIGLDFLRATGLLQVVQTGLLAIISISALFGLLVMLRAYLTRS